MKRAYLVAVAMLALPGALGGTVAGRIHGRLAVATFSSETKIATSPVVFGLRASVAKRLGWVTHRPTWSGIAAAAGEHRFTYAMTNPAASNSGFSALVGLAAALAGTGKALTPDQIAPLTPRLRAFFAGQSLTAGSSGWPADSYQRAATSNDPANRPIDGMVNDESVLLSLNAGGKLPEPLTIVYPSDGVVTAARRRVDRHPWVPVAGRG